MAGTIPLSLTQQFDELGNVLAGGKLYLIQAGTVATPQNGYQDSALTIPWPNPIILDAAGRLPQFFLADGSIKIRLTNSNGAEQLEADGILVVGASSGGGGGSPVDATTVLSTGDMKLVYNTGILSGFVRANGRTIGNASSGATERANADTSALFVFLYTADTNLAVSGGRGASAAADYAANKTIALPDCRGRGISGLDDMGNSAASRLSSSYFGATATTLGAAGGLESHTLTTAQLASHSHANTAGVNDSGHTHTSPNVSNNGGGAADLTVSGGTHNITNTVASATTGITVTMTNATAGSGSAHNNVQPTILMTFYVKL